MGRKINYPVIPPSLKVSKNKTCEVLFIDDFKDGVTMGECRPDPYQIVIKKNLGQKEEFKTFMHEVFHLASFEKDLNLTERQVLGLEDFFYKIMVLNKWI